MTLRHFQKRYATAFLAVAVVLFSPSIGLMTLPIPDNEPDTTSVTLISDAHVSKRVHAETLRIPAALISSATILPQIVPVFLNTPKTSDDDVSIIPHASYNSRAPPLV